MMRALIIYMGRKIFPSFRPSADLRLPPHGVQRWSHLNFCDSIGQICICCYRNQLHSAFTDH